MFRIPAAFACAFWLQAEAGVPAYGLGSNITWLGVYVLCGFVSVFAYDARPEELAECLMALNRLEEHQRRPSLVQIRKLRTCSGTACSR